MSGTDEKIISKQLLSGNSGELPSACQNPIGSFFGSKIAFFTKKFGPPSPPSSVDANFEPIFTSRFFLSAFWIFLTKLAIVKVLVALAMIGSAYLRQEWTLHERQYSLTSDETIYVTTRQCKVVISDSFRFKSVRTRTMKPIDFRDVSYFDSRSNNLWHENTGVNAKCIIEIPIARNHSSFNISCGDYCLVQVMTIWNSTISELFIAGNELSLKAKDVQIDSVSLVGRKIKVWGRDFTNQVFFVSAIYFSLHLNYFYKNESSILGLLPNSTSLGSNMDISQLGRSSLKSYIDSYIREDFIGIHWDSSFMISRLTPISNSTDLTLVCIKDWGVPCYSRQNSFLIFANQSDISIRNSEESSIKPGEFVSTAEFKLRDKQEYDLSVMASRVPKNGYMILEFPDLSFEDQSAFKVFAYSGYLLPLAAENFLQITQACKIMNSHRMEELSVSLQLNNDQSLIEFLSKEERIAFFTKLKNFIVEKLNKLSGRGGWEVVVAYPMGRDDRIYNPQLRVWVCFNIAVFLIVCAISGFVLYKMKKFGEKVIEREFKNIEKNEMLLKQLTRENFMFLDIAEILRPNTEPTEKNLPILLNFFSLGKLGERLSSYFSAISEQDFVELIVDLQPPNPESKLTFSKVFDACYIFYIQRGVQAHSLKAQDLQEALLSAGLLLQSNKSEPEYYITGRKLHSFHRGTLFKDKLFISMDLQVNSLEYFIQNHCKPSQNESDSISFAEFSGAYSVFCSATSANKQAFDETLLRELYEFQIKKMPLVEVCQGPPNKSGKCPSLKLEFIEALSKNLPYTSVIGKTGPLSAKANYARSMIIFVTLNLLEVIIISMILSSRKYLVFLFDIGITPRAISMYNDSKNVGLANMIASTSYEIERILIYYLPLYVSDLFIFFSTYYNITGRRVENLKRLSVFFGWILIVYFAIGVFLFIGLQVFEIFMFFFAAFQGPEHIIDLIVTLVKYSLTIYGFFSARRAIRNTKRQIKSQIDFYFMNLSNDFLEEKNRKAKKKEAEASEQRFKVSETLNSWMEQKKVSISYSLRRTKTTCSLIVESLKEPLNSEKLTVFISEVLGLDPSTPLVRLLVMLIELRSEKISKVELSSRLETLNSLFFLTICEGNEQHAQLFSCFINIYTANHNQNIEDLLYHSSKFFKQVIKPDSHKIIDLYLPLFISICYEDFYSSFSETSLRNLNNYLQALHPRLKHTFSEVPSYINHEIELARQKISQGRIDKSLNFTLDWSDIMNTVPDHLFQEIRTRNEDLKIVISDFFSEVHGPKSRKYLAESFAKVYELDPDLLKLFCDLILGLGCGEVDFTSVELKSNPYFRALKKRFKLSAIQLSGIFNITRNIFDSETSALYILHLLSRKYPLTLSLRFQFILMLFDRKSSLKHHIEAMMVPEPGLLYYSLTTRIFSISRAFEFFSNKSESRRALLKAILDSSPQKDLLEGKITAQNKLFLLEDQPLSEFIELCGVYMKLRNFNFDLGISAMMAVAPALKSIEKEDENQLFEVIQHIRSIRYKIKSSFISFETVSAMRAISLLENLERLSSSDLKTHYGFLADPLFNWDHIVNFLYKCRRHIGFSETTPCSALDTDLANFFTGEARSARLFKAILLQLKPFLPPSERKLIAKIEIDVSAFSLRTKTLSGRENPDPTARDLRPRVRNLIYRLFLTGEESSATIIYAFYFCIGILRRKDTVFSDFLEDNIARAFEVEPLLIRLIGQLGNPRVAEDPHELVFPLRDLLMALPEVAGSFHLKSIVTSVFRPDFVGNLGRIIKGQAGLEGFFEREVKDEALAGLLGLLVDLKLGQGAAFPHKALLFSQSLLEKYSLDVKEVIDLYNLCKRKGIDFAEYMVSGARKDSTDLFKSFLIAQSKLQLADSESQRQFLLHHSSLFKLLGLNEQVCWPALLARRGNFRLMRRFLRGQIRDQSLGGTTQQDLLEELLTLTHRARRILKGRSTGSGPASPALNCNVWLERLAALHGDPQGLAASTKSLGNSLSGFAYSVFLTVKYSPPRLAEYLFDFAFFTMAGKLVARKGHRRWKGPPPPAAAVDRRRRDLAGLLPALIRGGAIFPPYGKLCSMVSVSERKLFDSLLVEEGGKDPEAAYNEAVCVRLMRGWWMRLKDEAMKAELGPFVETAGKASLQELAFGGIQPPLNNAVYFASFVRFIEEDLCGCLCDLSRLNPGGVLRVEGLRGCGVDHEFGGSLFITIFVSKLGEASLAQGEGMYDQYASVVRNADLLFRFVEKQLFFLNGISIARKDFLLQQYLTYFGLILKPQHSVVLSPSLWSPCAAAYALRKMKKAGLGKNESVRELLVGFFKVDREIQEEIKVKVLAKVLETDLDNAKAGQQTQMFRQFYVDEPGVESLSSEALSGSGPLRRDSGSFAPRKDSGPPRKDSGSIYQRKDLGLTRLPDSGPADLSLYSPTASMDLGQLESFHYLSTVTRGRVGRGLYSLFERLNPWMFDKTLYEFELLSSGLARSKFGDSGEIFSAFFGIPLEEQSKLRFFQLSYFSLGRGCRVFDVRVDWKGEGPSFALLDGETRVQLRRVAALQSAAGAWNTANFLAAVKSSEARLRSRHAALGVVCEFLFASTPRCWLIRSEGNEGLRGGGRRLIGVGDTLELLGLPHKVRTTMVLAIDAILRPPMSEAEGGETRTSKHHFSDSREFDDLASAFTRLRPSPASESLSALRRLHHCPRDCPASIRRGAFHDFAHAASARLRAPQLESRLLELFAYIEGSTPPPPAAATVGRAVEDVPLPPLTAALGEQKLDMLIDLLKDLGGLELSAGVLAQIFWSALADSAATNLRSADLPSAARLLVFKLANAASRCSSGLKGFVRGLALKVCEVGVEGVARLCARMEPQGLWANVFQRKKFEGLRSEGLVRAMLEVIDKTDPPPNEAGRIYIVSAIEIVFGGKTSGFSEGQAIDAGSSEGWEIHARSCDSPQALEEVNRSDTRNLSNRQSGRPPSQPQGPNTIESAAILFLDTLPTFYHRLSLDSTSPSIRRRLAALDIAASELGCSLGSQARILATIRVFTAQLAGRRLSTFDDFFAAAERGVAAGLRGQPRLRAVARALDAENFHQGLAAAAAAADMVGLVRVFAAPARKMSDASLHGRLDALIVFFGLEERDDKMRFGELGMQEREAGVFDSAFAFFRKVEELRREVERPVEKSMRTLIDHPTKVTICDYQTSNLISEYSTRGIIGDYSLRSSDRRDSTRSFAIQNDRRESNRSCFTPTSREHSPPPISTNPEDLSHSPELSTIFEIRTALAKMRLAVEAREILRHLSSPDLSTPPDPTTSDFLSALKSTIYTSSKSKLHIFNAISLIFTLGIFQGIVLLIQFGKTFRFAGENGFETSMAGLLVVLFLAWMFSLKKAFFPWTETDIHAMVQCEINDLFKVNEQ